MENKKPFWESNLNPITLLENHNTLVPSHMRISDICKYYSINSEISNVKGLNTLFNEKYKYSRGYSFY